MPRTAKVVDIPAIGELDRLAGQLSHQLAQALRQAIHRGDLKAGDLLPSTRRLSAALNLARGTVLEGGPAWLNSPIDCARCCSARCCAAAVRWRQRRWA